MFQTLSERPVNLFVSFWICSDDQNFIEYLTKLDNNVFNLDLVDDYDNERKRCCQKAFLTRGNYLIKSLIAPFLPWMDNLDSIYVNSEELPPDYQSSWDHFKRCNRNLAEQPRFRQHFLGELPVTIKYPTESAEMILGHDHPQVVEARRRHPNFGAKKHYPGEIDCCVIL